MKRKNKPIKEDCYCPACNREGPELHAPDCERLQRRSLLHYLADLFFETGRKWRLLHEESRWYASDERKQRLESLKKSGKPAVSDPILKRISGRWFNQRVWFVFSPKHRLAIEAQVPTTSCSLELAFRADDGSPITVHIAIPLLFQVFISVSSPWLWRLSAWMYRRLPKSVTNDYMGGTSPYSTGFYFHDWSLWLKPFVSDSVCYGRNSGKPWWVRTRSLDLRALVLGQRQHKHEILGEWTPVLIPMIEGAYPGRVRFERREWWWPRLPFFNRIVQDYTQFETDRGVPFPGKGENSWDCGMDGLFGCGSGDHNIGKCIGHVVESVLRSRERYAGRREWIPSPQEREEWMNPPRRNDADAVAETTKKIT